MENVFTNNTVAPDVVDICLFYFPELGVIQPPEWLRKHRHYCLVETAAYLTALGVDGDEGRAAIRPFLQDEIAPLLNDARAQIENIAADQAKREAAAAAKAKQEESPNA